MNPLVLAVAFRLNKEPPDEVLKSRLLASQYNCEADSNRKNLPNRPIPSQFSVNWKNQRPQFQSPTSNCREGNSPGIAGELAAKPSWQISCDQGTADTRPQNVKTGHRFPSNDRVNRWSGIALRLKPEKGYFRRTPHQTVENQQPLRFVGIFRAGIIAVAGIRILLARFPCFGTGIPI